VLSVLNDDITVIVGVAAPPSEVTPIAQTRNNGENLKELIMP